MAFDPSRFPPGFLDRLDQHCAAGGQLALVPLGMEAEVATAMGLPIDTGAEEFPPEYPSILIEQLPHGFLVQGVNEEEFAFSNLADVGLWLEGAFNPPPKSIIN